MENIISTIGLDFLIWSIEQKKVKEISERNRKRIIKLIREYKDLLASKTPEELKKGIPPTLSREDKALREFIKFWSISEETVETRARVYRKPIFTALEKQGTTDYFVVFRYRGAIHTLGELSFSENKVDAKLSKNELERIKSLIAERCLEMDREFLKISYRRKDKVTTQIEKIIEKIEELKDVFEKIDVTILPRKDKEEILKALKKIEKVPPWKREDEITKLKDMLKEKLKARGYQKVLERPKLLAVIKYGRV